MSDTPEEKVPPGAPEVTEAEILELMAQDIGPTLQGLLGLFAPGFAEAEFPRLLAASVKEQLTIIKDILPSITDPEMIKKLPRFGIRVYPLKEGPKGPVPDVEKMLTMVASKQFSEANNDPLVVLQTAFMLAILFQPAVRALMRVHGFHYDFIQAKALQEPSLIVAP